MVTDSGSWTRLREAFENALDLASPHERDDYLRRALADSPDLLHEAQRMLEAHETADPLGIEKRLLNEGVPQEPSLIGKKIGPYRLQSLIGRGGMGEVYLAEREGAQFRQQVALKFLLPGLYSSEALARFRLERRILAKLNHSLIAPLLDGGVTEDARPY
ncbi:MAG: serine/threonine-protein kinase, partial [Bryobacteraceae bacterium]